MTPKDVVDAVKLIASSPVDRQRYGRTLDDLSLAWRRLFHCESIDGIVIEDLDAPGAGLQGLGVSVFVTDQFLRFCKTPPLFWIGPELVRRTLGDGGPVLAPKALRVANSGGGINVFAWAGHSRDIAESEIPQFSKEIMGAFLQQHAGLQMKEIISQPPALFNLQVTLSSGCFLWDSEGQQYVKCKGQDLTKIFEGPFLCGVTRSLALENVGAWSWMNPLFVWTAPRIGFAPSEQRLLICALKGLSDDELSDELAVSSSAVKKTWCSIYQRVAQRLPDVLPPCLPADHYRKARGKGKKQRLLAYLREHREELRPFTRKPTPEIRLQKGGRFPLAGAK